MPDFNPRQMYDEEGFPLSSGNSYGKIRPNFGENQVRSLDQIIEGQQYYMVNIVGKVFRRLIEIKRGPYETENGWGIEYVNLKWENHKGDNASCADLSIVPLDLIYWNLWNYLEMIPPTE